jgi:DNA-binding GntR family transcriptional regulator
MDNEFMKTEDVLARTIVTKDILPQLRTDIILGKYPAGSRLTEIKLAEQLGISRGPVRMALQILSQEGLCTNLPNGGTEVTGFTIKNVIDIFDFRLLMENKALEMILESKSLHYRPFLEVLDTLEDMNRKSKNVSIDTRATLLDIQFHRSIMIMSDNQAMLVAWNGMVNVLQSILQITNLTYTVFQDFYEEHKGLADLIIQKNVDSIAKLESHIFKAKNIIVKRMESIYAEQNE